MNAAYGTLLYICKRTADAVDDESIRD